MLPAAADKQHARLTAHLSVVRDGQRRGLTADDAHGHFVLQAARHPSGCGLVRRGARAHLTTVVVAPCVHLHGGGRKKEIKQMH